MTAQAALNSGEQGPWGKSLAFVLGAHGIAIVAVLALAAAPTHTIVPDPVMTVDLPGAAEPAGPVTPQSAQSEAEPTEQPITPQPVQQAEPPIVAPKLNIPIPANAVQVAEKPKLATPAPVAAAAPASARTAPAAAPAAAAPAAAPSSSQSAGLGDDPKARKAQADYFSQLAAYLRRNKQYPPEAKQARQQGIVTVRFTIDRGGNISGVSVRKGSGHTILDNATVALLQRVSPAPPLPASLGRDSLTISLPIEYSLSTK